MEVETDDSVLAAAAAEPGGGMTLSQVYREKIYKSKNITKDDYDKLSLKARVRLLKEAMGRPVTPEPVDFLDDDVLETEQGATILHQGACAVITALPGGTVKKWMECNSKQQPDMHEVEALRVAEEIGLPLVPRVRGTGVVPPQPGSSQLRCHYKSWIAMDRLEGEPLSGVWKGLSKEEKTAVAEQLRGFLAAMRSAPPPPFTSAVTNRDDNQRVGNGRTGGHLGTDFGRHFASRLRGRDSTPDDDAKGTHYGGPRPGMVGRDRYPDFLPCRSEAELNEYMLSYLLTYTPRPLIDALQRHLERGGPYRVVYSHGNLCMDNILVTKGNGAGAGPKLTGVVGWRFAGWFPEYWEYVKIFTHSYGMEDFRDYLPVMFAPNNYQDELVTYLALRPVQGDPTS